MFSNAQQFESQSLLASLSLDNSDVVRFFNNCQQDISSLVGEFLRSAALPLCYTWDASGATGALFFGRRDNFYFVSSIYFKTRTFSDLIASDDFIICRFLLESCSCVASLSNLLMFPFFQLIALAVSTNGTENRVARDVPAFPMAKYLPLYFEF